MGLYTTDEELARAGKFRELQRQRDERTLRRKNKQREAAEASRFSKPLSGQPAKRKKKSQLQPAEYWRQRAVTAEAALRMAGGKPAAGPTFYESQEWRVLRYKALKQHGAKCQLCGAAGAMHVDHIKPRSKYPELELRLDNLQVLCADCNLGKGAWDESDWRRGALKSIPGE